jgi:hypothetical protein
MAAKYPPRDDEGLLAAGNQFNDNVGDPTVIGLSAEDITRLANSVSAGQTAFDKHTASQIKARTDTQVKDAELGTLERYFERV